jgi:hypothetical protein
MSGLVIRPEGAGASASVGALSSWNNATKRTLQIVRIGEGFPTFSDRTPFLDLSPAHEYSRGFLFECS